MPYIKRIDVGRSYVVICPQPKVPAYTCLPMPIPPACGRCGAGVVDLTRTGLRSSWYGYRLLFGWTLERTNLPWRAPISYLKPAIPPPATGDYASAPRAPYPTPATGTYATSLPPPDNAAVLTTTSYPHLHSPQPHHPPPACHSTWALPHPHLPSTYHLSFGTAFRRGTAAFVEQGASTGLLFWPFSRRHCRTCVYWHFTLPLPSYQRISSCSPAFLCRTTASRLRAGAPAIFATHHCR